MTVTTTFRQVKRTFSEAFSAITVEEPRPGTEAFNESDSNADTCCLGKNFIVLHYTNRTADVYAYDKSLEPLRNVPIVSGATLVDLPDGTSIILVINEALYYGTKLNHSLINPNQVRHAGIQFWDNPYDHTQPLSISIERGLEIPMHYYGTKLRFKSRAPTNKELNELKHVQITSKRPWEPTEVILGKVKTTNKKRRIFNVQVGEKQGYMKPNSDDAILHEIEPSLIKIKEIARNQVFTHEDVPSRSTFISTNRHSKATVESLAENWGIGTHKARATLNATTQHFTRSAVLPLSHRYRADRMYNLKRLNGKFATDALWADNKSINKHKYAAKLR